MCVRYGAERRRPLNLSATSLRDLINWSLPTAKESPLTVGFSKVVSTLKCSRFYSIMSFF